MQTRSSEIARTKESHTIISLFPFLTCKINPQGLVHTPYTYNTSTYTNYSFPVFTSSHLPNTEIPASNRYSSPHLTLPSSFSSVTQFTSSLLPITQIPLSQPTSLPTAHSPRLFSPSQSLPAVPFHLHFTSITLSSHPHSFLWNGGTGRKNGSKKM